MAKPAAFAALFVALIAVASAHNDEESCQTEVQQMQMTPCMQWISPSQSASFIRSVVAEEHQQECCAEMRKVREDCRCEMMKKMMMEMPKMSAFTRMKKILSMFRDCHVEFPKGCSFP